MTASKTETIPAARSDRSDEAMRLDAFAASCVARLAPVRFAIAATESEREDLVRLSYLAVIERGWAAPDDFPDGLEREPEDERAVHVGAWDGETPIAAGRLIFPSPDRALPIECVFDIQVEPRGRVVQVDRLTVGSSCRGRGSRFFFGIISQCWIEMRKRGFSISVGTESTAMLRLWDRLGFSKTVLAPARQYWGELRYPVRFEPAQAAPDLADRVFARF